MIGEGARMSRAKFYISPCCPCVGVDECVQCVGGGGLVWLCNEGGAERVLVV